MREIYKFWRQLREGGAPATKLPEGEYYVFTPDRSDLLVIRNGKATLNPLNV